MGDKVYEPSQYTKIDLERRDNDDMYAASYSKHSTADAKKERYFKSHKNKSKSIKKREIGKSLDAADWEVAINDGDAERQEKKKHKSVTSDYIFSDFSERPKLGGGRRRGGATRKRSTSKSGGATRKRSTSKGKSGGATRKRSTSKGKSGGATRKRSTSKTGGGRKRKSSTRKSGAGPKRRGTRK